MSAYACEPGKGSEPGVGWNLAREMAQRHEVWVITRTNNRSAIEAELAHLPIPNLHFVYYDLPIWARWWKGARGSLQLYYYLWQVGVYRIAHRLHKRVDFDLAHHVTFVKYWAPSLLHLLPVPFIFGPVGGGESAPRPFLQDFSLRGRLFEHARDCARYLGERDPLVRMTVRRSRLAIATTIDTARRLDHLGAKRIEILPQVAFDSDNGELENQRTVAPDSPNPLISIGNLLHWKGFHLALRAFADASLGDTEYWIIGDGPERERLQALARSLGVSEKCTFWGRLSHHETLDKLSQAQFLVHPSLHDSGGFVCLEAMAAGKPVICLDLGGPAMQVTPETGFKIDANTPNQVVDDLASAMRILISNRKLREEMAEAGRQRSREEFSWQRKAEILAEFYDEAQSG